VADGDHQVDPAASSVLGQAVHDLDDLSDTGLIDSVVRDDVRDLVGRVGLRQEGLPRLSLMAK
jgi:hypothetical protein